MTEYSELTALLLDPFLTVGEVERQCGAECPSARRLGRVAGHSARPGAVRAAAVLHQPADRKAPLDAGGRDATPAGSV
jgi:hypothetical protein